MSPKKKKKKWPSTRLDLLVPGAVEASLGTPCQGHFYTVLAAQGRQGKCRPDRVARENDLRTCRRHLQFRHFSKVSETAFSHLRLDEEPNLSSTLTFFHQRTSPNSSAHSVLQLHTRWMKRQPLQIVRPTSRRLFASGAHGGRFIRCARIGYATSSLALFPNLARTNFVFQPWIHGIILNMRLSLTDATLAGLRAH